ncbi:hypothetical protein Tco_1166099 [Tanacetum coccineum]
MSKNGFEGTEIIRVLAGPEPYSYVLLAALTVTRACALSDVYNTILEMLWAVMSNNGFDGTEIIRVLAGQLNTVAAMADESSFFNCGFVQLSWAIRRSNRHIVLAKEVDIIKKTENQAKMTKLSMEWKRLCKINAKVRVKTEESAVKPEPELKNTIECNLNPSDGPGKPNSITVKTKWALNQLQQPICVHLTKTVKTLKAQS